MIDSLFVLTGNASFVLEKHFQQTYPRSICEPFLQALDDIKMSVR